MENNLYIKIISNDKEKKYLEENSYYIKYLNRNPNNYYNFIKEMKKIYKDRKIDKIENTINTIDIITSIADNLK